MQNGTGLETETITEIELKLVQRLFSCYQQDVHQPNDFIIHSDFNSVMHIILGNTKVISQDCLAQNKIAIGIHPTTPKLIEIRNYRGSCDHPIPMRSDSTFLRFLTEADLENKMNEIGI
jgi:hypothetical protein